MDVNAIAREYLRVSYDRSGRMRSPAEQHADNARDAERHGWTLHQPYAEPKAVGASRYSKGRQIAFEQLVDDLEAGRFAAHILIMWETSRVSRRNSVWARFLDGLEDHGVKLYVTSHGRLYDLADPRDRRAMQEEGPDNEFEVTRLRARVIRGVAANAAAGRPNGQPPYGYVPVRDRSGRLLTWEPDPLRAPVVAELFERVRSGDTIRSIAHDFEARGIVNGSGHPFHQAHLRRLLPRVAYVGLREHHGKTTPAIWPGIVEADAFWTVQQIIGDPGRLTRLSARAVHTYTMIVRCDVCDGPMAAVARRGSQWYRCNANFCVTIDKGAVDELLDAAVVDFLSRPDRYRRFAEPDPAAARSVAGELAEARAEMLKAEAERPRTVHQARALGVLMEDLAATIDRLEERQRELSTPPALRNLIGPGADVAARWGAAQVHVRRQVAQMLLCPGVLGEVRVVRSPVRGRAPQPPAVDRIVWRR